MTNLPPELLPDGASPDTINVGGGRHSLDVRPGRALHYGLPYGETVGFRALFPYVPPSGAPITHPRLIGVIGANVYATGGPKQKFKDETAIVSISRSSGNVVTVNTGSVVNGVCRLPL